MPRGSNFYYSGNDQLGAALGQTLGRALFGDPEAAAKLQLQQAQMDNYAASAEEARKHGGLYDAQTNDQTQRTAGSRQLSDLFAGFANQPTTAVPGVAPAPAFTPEAVHSALPAMLAAMALAKGDDLPVAETLAQLPAYSGDDTLARQSMIAQRHTPGKEFAVTSGRADAIAKQGNDADYRQATDVARINHSTDVAVANANHASDIPVANIQANAKRDVASLGKTVGFSLVSDVLPGAQMTSGERSPEHNAAVDGAAHSYHLPGDGVEAFDIKPGTGARTFADAKAAMQKTYGSRLIEAIDETTRPGHGPHWHFAVADAPGGKKSPAAKPPKDVSAADLKMLDGELTNQLKARGWNLNAGALNNVRQAAVMRFQSSGDPIGSVKGILDDVVNKARQQGKTKGGSDLRGQALAAIQKGADPAAVRARYKKMTGQELGS
jgi:hypothetical protein